MRKLQFYKYHSNHHIAHLYEHVFVARLLRIMREKGLYRYVDYDIDAWTYYSGNILITIELYNHDVPPIFDEIFTNKHSFTTEEVLLGGSQLISEDGEQFDSDGLDKITEEINKLELRDWTYFSELDFVKIGRKPRQSKVLQIIGKPVKTKNIKLNLLFKYKNTADIRLSAMFKQLSRIINDNCTDYICDKYGFSVRDFRYTQNSKNARLETIISVRKDLDIDTNEILSLYLECYREIVSKSAIERYLNNILSNTMDDNYKPNVHLTVVDNGLLIGDKGWRLLANANNKDKILSSLQLQVQIGTSVAETSIH